MSTDRSPESNEPDPTATEPADPGGDPAKSGGDESFLEPTDADAPSSGSGGTLGTPPPPD